MAGTTTTRRRSRRTSSRLSEEEEQRRGQSSSESSDDDGSDGGGYSSSASASSSSILSPAQPAAASAAASGRRRRHTDRSRRRRTRAGSSIGEGHGEPEPEPEPKRERGDGNVDVGADADGSGKEGETATGEGDGGEGTDEAKVVGIDQRVDGSSTVKKKVEEGGASSFDEARGGVEETSAISSRSTQRPPEGSVESGKSESRSDSRLDVVAQPSWAAVGTSSSAKKEAAHRSDSRSSADVVGDVKRDAETATAMATASAPGAARADSDAVARERMSTLLNLLEASERSPSRQKSPAAAAATPPPAAPPVPPHALAKKLSGILGGSSQERQRLGRSSSQQPMASRGGSARSVPHRDASGDGSSSSEDSSDEEETRGGRHQRQGGNKRKRTLPTSTTAADLASPSSRRRRHKDDYDDESGRWRRVQYAMRILTNPDRAATRRFILEGAAEAKRRRHECAMASLLATTTASSRGLSTTSLPRSSSSRPRPTAPARSAVSSDEHDSDSDDDEREKKDISKSLPTADIPRATSSRNLDAQRVQRPSPSSSLKSSFPPDGGGGGGGRSDRMKVGGGGEVSLSSLTAAAAAGPLASSSAASPAVVGPSVRLPPPHTLSSVLPPVVADRVRQTSHDSAMAARARSTSSVAFDPWLAVAAAANSSSTSAGRAAVASTTASSSSTGPVGGGGVGQGQVMDLTVDATVSGTSTSSSQSPPQSSKKQRNKIKKTFPEKLMSLLSQKDTRHAITWLPSGESFCIVNPKKLVSDVLPKFFKQSKFESFTRKLKRWGFKRISSGFEYKNEFFRRDDPDMCQRMRAHNPPDQHTSASHASEEVYSAGGGAGEGEGGVVTNIDSGLGHSDDGGELPDAAAQQQQQQAASLGKAQELLEAYRRMGRLPSMTTTPPSPASLAKYALLSSGGLQGSGVGAATGRAVPASEQQQRQQQQQQQQRMIPDWMGMVEKKLPSSLAQQMPLLNSGIYSGAGRYHQSGDTSQQSSQRKILEANIAASLLGPTRSNVSAGQRQHQSVLSTSDMFAAKYSTSSAQDASASLLGVARKSTDGAPNLETRGSSEADALASYLRHAAQPASSSTDATRSYLHRLRQGAEEPPQQQMNSSLDLDSLLKSLRDKKRRLSNEAA